MLESKILPTILIVLPSSVFLLLAQPEKAAAEKCNTSPSSSAPPGSHWYYRVNHTDNRRCWFLSSEGMKVRSDARAVTSDVATPKRNDDSEMARATSPQSAQIAPVEIAPAQATPAGPALLETRVDGQPTAMDFSTRWPDLSEPPNLEASEPATSSSYTDTLTAADAERQMPLIWPVAEAGRVRQQEDPAGQAAFGSVFPVGALALGLLSLSGGVFMLVRRTRQGYVREPSRATKGQSGRVTRPTDPAHDLKTSLAELMQDLQRAGAAGYSPRAFAPLVRGARQGPAPEANHTERGAEGLKFKQQRKASTVPFRLSERVASILGVEPSSP
jgi:hypothetical protein